MQHQEPRAVSVDDFCAAHAISRSTYYRLKKAGLGPDELRARGKHLITVESAQRWRKKMTQKSPSNYQATVEVCR